MGLSAGPGQIDSLAAYLNLLDQWNRKFNLTAIRDPEKMLIYHLLDSLSIYRWIPDRAKALDVGSGAGLPGIPLAIILPHTQWWLLDSNGKKTRFMQQALAVCNVKNATVVKSRIEDYHADQPFDVIVSRAYASLVDFIHSVAGSAQKGTLMMAMKTGLEDERAVLDENRYDQQVHDLQVPGIADSRKLITVKQRQK